MQAALPARREQGLLDDCGRQHNTQDGTLDENRQSVPNLTFAAGSWSTALRQAVSRSASTPLVARSAVTGKLCPPSRKCTATVSLACGSASCGEDSCVHKQMRHEWDAQLYRTSFDVAIPGLPAPLRCSSPQELDLANRPEHSS